MSQSNFIFNFSKTTERRQKMEKIISVRVKGRNFTLRGLTDSQVREFATNPGEIEKFIEKNYKNVNEQENKVQRLQSNAPSVSMSKHRSKLFTEFEFKSANFAFKKHKKSDSATGNCFGQLNNYVERKLAGVYDYTEDDVHDDELEDEIQDKVQLEDEIQDKVQQLHSNASTVSMKRSFAMFHNILKEIKGEFPDETITVASVQKRWSSIRDAYCKILRKNRQSSGSGYKEPEIGQFEQLTTVFF